MILAYQWVGSHAGWWSMEFASSGGQQVVCRSIPWSARYSGIDPQTSLEGLDGSEAQSVSWHAIHGYPDDQVLSGHRLAQGDLSGA